MAGDICAAVGLKTVSTGDTICDDRAPIVLESIDFPTPVIQLAVEPKTKADQEKLGMAIQKLAQEDPTFRVNTDPETGQTILSGHGRAAPRNHRGPHDARIRRRRQCRQAAGGVSRDHPQESGSGRPAREAVGRPRPVRRRARSGSSRCRRAAGSNSRTTSTAARFPRNSSTRSKPESRKRSKAAFSPASRCRT